MSKSQENSEIITSSKSPIITMPKRVFPTNTNYGTCRFNNREVIVCKDVAFMITFISAKKMSLKPLDKKFADAIIAGEPI